MDDKTAAEKIRAYYKSNLNKGQRPVFNKVKYSHEEVIDKLMPYLKKGTSRYDSESKNVKQGTIVGRLKDCFRVRWLLGGRQSEHLTSKGNEKWSKVKGVERYEEHINKIAEEKANEKGCSVDLGAIGDYKEGFKEGYKEGCSATRKLIVNNLRESGYSEKDMARFLLECGFNQDEIK